jgi:hypothetical protein
VGDGNDSGDLFSRDEILAGGSGAGRDTRRARAIVYLIEQEAQRAGDRQAGITAAGAAASAMAGSPLRLDDLLDAEAQRGDLPGEADEAYLESFRAARRHASSPELRRLEREADHWAPLVPERTDLRARVLDLLAQRYELTTRNARRILATFGAADPAFADTFARTCGRSLDEAVPTPPGGLLSRFRRR